MIITGKTINSEVNDKIIPEPFVKVFVSTVDGLITPKKIGTTSDENGDFTLDISNRDGEYLSASIVGTKTITNIKEGVDYYALKVTGNVNQQIKEVTVTAKKPVKEPVKEPEPVKVVKIEPVIIPPKKSYWWIIIPVSIGAVLIAVGIYYASKKK